MAVFYYERCVCQYYQQDLVNTVATAVPLLVALREVQIGEERKLGITALHCQDEAEIYITLF